MTNYLVTLLTLTCTMGNANPAPAEYHSLCDRIFKSSESCPRQLSYYKKAFFTDLYGNKKEKISFSDYINHFKSVGYGFPSYQIEGQAKFFYRFIKFEEEDDKINLAEFLYMQSIVDTDNLRREFNLIDKNQDGYVSMMELNLFSWAVYKKEWLNEDELRDQENMFRNSYPKDLLGPDGRFDFEEYLYWKNTSPGSSFETTTKRIIKNFGSGKPFHFWDKNGDGKLTFAEYNRFSTPRYY